MKNMLAQLYPKEVITCEVNPSRCRDMLLPEEERFVRCAVMKRRKEFTAGRACTRKALAEMGLHDLPIPVGPDRAPVWPQGVTGSISHTEDWCGAALARTSYFRSIGLDIEYAAINAELWPHICTNDETTWLESLVSGDRPKYVALIFSAKECLYKCLYPIVKQWIGFHDAQVFVQADDGTFRAKLNADVGRFRKRTTFKGKYFFRGRHICTGMTLSNTAS